MNERRREAAAERPYWKRPDQATTSPGDRPEGPTRSDQVGPAARQELDAKERLRLLASLGREMRTAQATYFDTRDLGDLNRAKELERGFDAEVARILDPKLF